MNLDLFSPDRNALLSKWKHVLDSTQRQWSWTTDSEIAWLCELASQRGGPILELGSFVGKSARAQLLASLAAHITCIDLWDDTGSYDEFKFNLRHEEAAGRVRSMRSATHDGLTNLAKENNEKYSYAFVDAGHLYDDVYGDIIGALKMIKKGGVICGHDYRDNLPEDGVTKAVREFLPGHKNVLDSIWAYQL